MKRRLRYFRISRAGFTLIEVLVATVIIAIMTTFIISSFSKNRVNVPRAASLVMSEIRKAQGYAVSAKTVPYSPDYPTQEGTLRCGYGIRYLDSTTMQIYAGPDSQLTPCNTSPRNYDTAQGDFIFETIKIQDPKVEFKESFFNVFFEPPDPRTYICSGSCAGSACGSTCASLGNTTPLTITLWEIGTTACTAETPCKYIDVYTSGKIELR